MAFAVRDVVMGAVERRTGRLFIDSAIPARRGTPDFWFLVIHEIEVEVGFDLTRLIGKVARLVVEEGRRQLLSAAHTSGTFRRSR